MLKLDFNSSVFCDGLLVNHDGELLFMSIWGRDTDIAETVARLTMRVTVPSPKLLDKQQGRSPRSVFGDLIQLFVYASNLQQPDRVSREAWAIYRIEDTASGPPDVWPLVMETCHVPLLPKWREPVLQAFTARRWITHFVGFRMGAVGVHLGDENLELCIEELIHDGQLAL